MTVEGQEIKAALRELKAELTGQIADLRKEVAEARKEVAEASKFQDGFQSVIRTLTVVLGIVVALASVYGVLSK